MYCIILWSPEQYNVVRRIRNVPASLHTQLAGLFSSPLLLLPSTIVLITFLALTFLPPAFFRQVQSPSVHRNAEVVLKLAARGRCAFVLTAVLLEYAFFLVTVT